MKNENAVKAFVALGHESRLAIFKLLTKKGEAGMPAGEIARYFDMPGATLSFHLSQLVAAKLVDSLKEGRTIHYSVKFKRIKKLMNYLSENYYKNKHLDRLPSIEIQDNPDNSEKTLPPFTPIAQYSKKPEEL
jgi:DNA-binding transcriptional ArsR family regulator